MLAIGGGAWFDRASDGRAPRAPSPDLNTGDR